MPRSVSGLLCALIVFASFSSMAAQDPTAAEPSTIQVVPRSQDLKFYPCSTCHDGIPTNSERRTVSIHPVNFDHGDGRIWCLDCHQAEQRDFLTTRGSSPYTFDEAPEVCATCHAQHYGDWRGGAHGKRVGNWQGDRTVYSCVHCHDPHDPAIKPRPPGPPPQVRRGLEPAQPSESEGWRPSWQQRDDQQGQQ